MTQKECLDKYFSLMEQRPHLFTDSEIIPIVKDRKAIERFSEETGKLIGVIYQSRYNSWIVDLVRGKNGEFYTYERAVPGTDVRGVICIPIYKDQYILLKQYRHAIRGSQICFPRGYGEPSSSSIENVIRELYEELGATIKWVNKIGEVAADSGLTSAIADVYVCEVESYDSTVRSEGITDIFRCQGEELKAMISDGRINDGFTISAFAMMQQRQPSCN